MPPEFPSACGPSPVFAILCRLTQYFLLRPNLFSSMQRLGKSWKTFISRHALPLAKTTLNAMLHRQSIFGIYLHFLCILTPRTRLSCCCCSCCVTEKSHPYTMRSSSSNHHTVAWVTRPERPKGAKDEVKQARRAQSRPEGPPPRSRGPEGP